MRCWLKRRREVNRFKSTMENRKFTIGLVQVSLDGTPEINLKKCSDWIRKATAEGAQVICLPELYSSFYFCQHEKHSYFNLAEPRYGTSFSEFSKLAAELQVVLVVPFFEKRAPGIFHNSAIILDSDGTEAGFYRKMHIPDDPGYYEKFYFTPGDLGFNAFDTRYGRIGTLICWDQWYPEGARLTALRGAEVLFYPTAIGWHPNEKQEYGEKQYDAWRIVQRGHAVANGIYVAACNRVGFEQPVKETAGIEFWGASFIAGPQGEILAQASHDKEEVILAEVNTGMMEDVRRNWPFFRDRRVDAYGDITQRYLE